jgi:hypothetical protein
MKPSEDNIKKTIGKYPEKSPLQKLKELNEALKKLGCKNEPDRYGTLYRKIVGIR